MKQEEEEEEPIDILYTIYGYMNQFKSAVFNYKRKSSSEVDVSKIA
jgi:hypothetical protein